jgi:hypothetical protein
MVAAVFLERSVADKYSFECILLPHLSDYYSNNNLIDWKGQGTFRCIAFYKST